MILQLQSEDTASLRACGYDREGDAPAEPHRAHRFPRHRFGGSLALPVRRRSDSLVHVAGALAVFLVTLVASTAVRGESPITLRDVTPQTGITFKHTTGGSGQYYIVEGVCCGMATFDYDGDGWVDVYFLNGAPLRGSRTDRTPRNALFRNDGGLGFTDVTDEAGVGDPGYGLGVA